MAIEDTTPSYALYGTEDMEEEWARLDAQHNGVAAFLGSEITSAPLRESPKKILEIGCGSGAWAIQAAKQFPSAEVIATDIFPLPNRPLPSNIKYEKVNVLEPLPFEPGTFDLIHARFVLIHIPHVDAILPRIISLLAPGGFLVIEDVDLTGDYERFKPGMKRCLSSFTSFMQSNGQDPAFGSHLAQNLRLPGTFDKLNIDMTMVPMNPPPDDSSPLAELGRTIKVGLGTGLTNVPSTSAMASVMTPEIRKGWSEEVERPDWQYDVGFFVAWARRAPNNMRQ